MLVLAALPGPLATAASQPAAPGADWREAPGYLPLLTPRLHRADYTVYVAAAGLDTVLRSLEGEASLLRPPGAWTAQPAGAWDAFGAAAEYNRWQIAALYGATRARVARGPRAPEGRISESWTLVSPYPDPGFQRLIEGTMLIVLRLPGS